MNSAMLEETEEELFLCMRSSCYDWPCCSCELGSEEDGMPFWATMVGSSLVY